jgi:electron transfer flavoprotein beta subunit
MNVLVCVKRVPVPGSRIDLTADAQEINTRFLKFTISPHEECAVEEALRLTEAHGGTTTVLTLGAAVAVEQLRDALAMGIDQAVLLETDEQEWDPAATAGAIAAEARAQQAAGEPFDLLLFGNESADSGGYQVGIRVAHALDLPCITGVKMLEIKDGMAIAKREGLGGWELYEMSLPAVITVRDGINVPRYPSVPGRLKAKRKPVAQSRPAWPGNELEKVRLQAPQAAEHKVEILGRGSEATVRVVQLLKSWEIL